MSVDSLFQRFFRKYNKILSLLILALLFLGMLFSFDYFLGVKFISIDGTTSSLYGIEKLKKSNILFIQEAKIQNSLKKENPLIDEIYIKKKYPSTLLITVRELKSFAYIKGNTKYLIISDNGRILQKTNEKPVNIPNIRYYQVINEDIFKTGDKIQFKDLNAGLFFLKALQDIGLNVESVDIVGFDMVLCKVNSSEIIFSTEKEKEQQIYNAGEVIKKFRVEGKEYRKIDVRFEKPFVTF